MPGRSAASAGEGAPIGRPAGPRRVGRSISRIQSRNPSLRADWGWIGVWIQGGLGAGFSPRLRCWNGFDAVLQRRTGDPSRVDGAFLWRLVVNYKGTWPSVGEIGAYTEQPGLCRFGIVLLFVVCLYPMSRAGCMQMIPIGPQPSYPT